MAFTQFIQFYSSNALTRWVIFLFLQMKKMRQERLHNQAQVTQAISCRIGRGTQPCLTSRPVFSPHPTCIGLLYCKCLCVSQSPLLTPPVLCPPPTQQNQILESSGSFILIFVYLSQSLVHFASLITCGSSVKGFNIFFSASLRIFFPCVPVHEGIL